MAEQLTSLVDSIGGLSLADRTTKLTGSGSNSQSPSQQALAEAIRTLIQSAEATATTARQVESLEECTHTLRDQHISHLSYLRREANALASATKIFSDAAKRYIIACITSLAAPGSLVREMLSHFDGELKSIIQDVLNSTSDDSNALREILEMCCNQALDTSGTLHSDNYFVPLGETPLQWPYDPDYESEEYYEHEARLAVDEGYAEAFRMRCEREAEMERQQKEGWIRFWVQALSECPDGPTLFYPPASRLPQFRLADVPRYLFRTFDDESTGRSDDNIVASTESMSATSSRSKVDLLSRTEQEATRMLYGHLNKRCFREKEDDEDGDNLMSWSSSLPFVIQYAVWRSHRRPCAPAEVKICMVDTRMFPRGQFARDKSLLRAYRHAPEFDKKMREFFKFRQSRDYDNGEYLSQGILHHSGRSAVVSLEQLIQAGLYELYPEFAHRAGMAWTNRVKRLRSIWSPKVTTSRLEIQKAVGMAKACFNRFDTPDVALLLLSFKDRKLREQISSEVQERLRILNDCGPIEVQRYMAIAETMKSRGLRGLNVSRRDGQILEEVFEFS